MPTFSRGSPIDTRPVSRVATVSVRGWACRVYFIRQENDRTPAEDFISGLVESLAALPALPHPARPGVTVAVRHPGADRDYAVLMWWDNRNELVTRVLIRAPGESAWSDAGTSASFCVWDMVVLMAERDHYIDLVLRPEAPDVEAYAARWPSAAACNADGALRTAPAPVGLLDALGAVEAFDRCDAGPDA